MQTQNLKRRSGKDVHESPSSTNKESPREALSCWVKLKMIVQNRYVRMVVFTLACFFTSALYYGWQQYQLMLFHDGAYEWLCKGAEDLDPESGDCIPQTNAISRLYSIAAGCEYASAALGGMLLDHVGPRQTAMIGEAMWGIATLMLAFSSRSAQMYIPAMVILGSSVNTVCFPSLTTVETFPKWQGTMVAIMLAAQTAATGIPPILYHLQTTYNYSFRAIWLMYLLVIWIPISLLYFLALPNRRDFSQVLKLQRKELMELADKAEAKTREIEGPNASTPPPLGEQMVPPSAESTVELVQRKASWREFWISIQTPEIMVMSCYFFSVMLMYAFYPTVVRSAISTRISDFVGWIMPAQAVAALLVGLLCDYVSTPGVMIGMCVCLEFTLIAALWPAANALQYASATVFVLSQCAVFEVKFTYVHELFDPYNFGKLVGLLGIVGGIGTFVNIPVAGSSSMRRAFIGYAIFNPIVCLTAGWMWWRQKKGHTYKTMPSTKMGQDEETKRLADGMGSDVIVSEDSFRVIA